jgi:ribonuclease J
LANWETVSKEPSRFILCFSYWDINELTLIDPSPGSVYIYSSSEAYDEEQKADVGRLRKWLDHFGITPLGVPDPATGKPLPGETGLHASGHASANDLLALIDIINPEILVPIHTELPEFFVERCAKARSVIVPRTLEAVAV